MSSKEVRTRHGTKALTPRGVPDALSELDVAAVHTLARRTRSGVRVAGYAYLPA